MDATDVTAGDATEAVASSSDEFIQESLEMILNNYWGLIERKGESLGADHLCDILKAFALYLYGNDVRRVSLMPSEEADMKLREAVSGKGVKLRSGFHSWECVSTIVQGLQMMDPPISSGELVRAFISFAEIFAKGPRMSDALGDVLVLRDNVNDVVTSLILSDEVLLPWYSLTTLSRITGKKTMVMDSNVSDLKRLTMLLTGTSCIERNGPMATTSFRGGATSRDAILFDPSMIEVDDYSLIKWVMDSIPEGCALILITTSAFNNSSTEKTERAREYLKGFRIDCQYHVYDGQFFHTVPLFVTRIINAPAGGPIRLIDTYEDRELTVDQSEFDWDLPYLIHRDDYGRFDTVRIRDLADLTFGIVVKSLESLVPYDPPLPVYIDNKSRDGLYLRPRTELKCVPTNDVRTVPSGSVLVSRFGSVEATIAVRESDTPCAASHHYFVITPKSDYETEYLLAFFKSEFYLFQSTEGQMTTWHYLSTREIKNMRVPAANKEQREAIAKAFLKLDSPEPEEVWAIFKKVLKINS